MENPYKILGVPETATDEEIKQAYRALARKYHPDNYHDSPLEDMAQEKMKEINQAYEAVTRQRSSGQHTGSGYSAYNSGYTGDPMFQQIRYAIRTGNLTQAEALLANCTNHGAEWHFLMGVICSRRGWMDDAFRYYQQAYQMEPGNPEYRQAVEYMANINARVYRPDGRVFGTDTPCSNPCVSMCCASMLCNLCSFGRFHFCFLP